MGLERAGESLVRGGGTLLSCEAARSPGTGLRVGVGCVAGPPLHGRRGCVGGVGVGLFLENYIVDASIL